MWASGVMVAALVLGTSGAIRGGSSPLSPTVYGLYSVGQYQQTPQASGPRCLVIYLVRNLVYLLTGTFPSVD